jgi:hypothetical protein
MVDGGSGERKKIEKKKEAIETHEGNTKLKRRRFGEKDLNQFFEYSFK